MFVHARKPVWLLSTEQRSPNVTLRISSPVCNFAGVVYIGDFSINPVVFTRKRKKKLKKVRLLWIYVKEQYNWYLYLKVKIMRKSETPKQNTYLFQESLKMWKWISFLPIHLSFRKPLFFHHLLNRLCAFQLQRQLRNSLTIQDT